MESSEGEIYKDNHRSLIVIPSHPYSRLSRKQNTHTLVHTRTQEVAPFCVCFNLQVSFEPKSWDPRASVVFSFAPTACLKVLKAPQDFAPSSQSLALLLRSSYSPHRPSPCPLEQLPPKAARRTSQTLRPDTSVPSSFSMLPSGIPSCHESRSNCLMMSCRGELPRASSWGGHGRRAERERRDGLEGGCKNKSEQSRNDRSKGGEGAPMKKRRGSRREKGARVQGRERRTDLVVVEGEKRGGDVSTNERTNGTVGPWGPFFWRRLARKGEASMYRRQRRRRV